MSLINYKSILIGVILKSLTWDSVRTPAAKDFDDVCPNWLMAVQGCTSCTGDAFTGSHNPGCKHMCFSLPSAVGRSGQRIHIMLARWSFPWWAHHAGWIWFLQTGTPPLAIAFASVNSVETELVSSNGRELREVDWINIEPLITAVLTLLD